MQVVRQTYRFELDSNEAQRVLLAKSVGASRFVYNWGLEQSQRDYHRLGKRPRLSELKSRLVELKQGECPWLYEVSAHIGQSALKDLNDAFERFFKGLKRDGPKSASRDSKGAEFMTQRGCTPLLSRSGTCAYR
jgi:putative transposase